MCILQQVRYSTVEHNFMIECSVCIGKIWFSWIMDFNIEIDHSATHADIG